MPTSSFVRSRPVIAGLAGLGLLGVLAGCAATAATGGSGSTGSDAGSSSTGSDSGSDSSTGTGTSGPYKDGSYTADGSYQAPSGTETITVTLTLADDKVTKVEIGKHATDPNAVQYQTMFADGIASQVVGKDISTLSVSRVAGSSLTSNGFRVAVAAIEKQAATS